MKTPSNSKQMSNSKSSNKDRWHKISKEGVNKDPPYSRVRSLEFSTQAQTQVQIKHFHLTKQEGYKAQIELQQYPNEIPWTKMKVS